MESSYFNETVFFINKDYYIGSLVKKVLYCILMTFVSLMAVFGNTVAIVAMVRNRRLQTVKNYDFLNLKNK